jgi:ABC-2 type transport system permease protein
MFLLALPAKPFAHKIIKMETKIPKPSEAFLSLMRADFTTQWRNRRSVMMSLLVPIIILISWKGLIARLGGPFVFSISLTIGLTSIGMMGYAISVARDRDKGIFQRLRVTPVPTSFIMMSRLAVQLGMIALLTLGVFIIGYEVDKISLTPTGYILTFITAFLGGALYLGFGQMIVGLIKSAETVNSTTRLVYIAFIMLGMFGELSDNSEFKNIVHWSPFGTVKTILAAAMLPSAWNSDATFALLATLAYAIVFSFLGIKWFKWSSAGA